MKRSEDASDALLTNLKSRIENPRAADLTRREWLLKLGEAAVLVGFSGAVEEGHLLLAQPQDAQAPDASALPPGLYAPSSDHLSHALSSDRLFHPAPPGSETDYAQPLPEPFKPRFFSEGEFQTVWRIVQVMLDEEAEMASAPASAGDDHENVSLVVAAWIDLRVSSAAAVQAAARSLPPDHRSLAVAHYGPEAVHHLESADLQTVSREGLCWLEDESQRQYRGPFSTLGKTEQVALLQLVSDDRADRVENPGTRWFSLVKSEVIRGFYTSRTGLKELDYKGSSFYAEFPDCDAHRHPS